MVGRVAIHDCRLLFIVNSDHNPVHVWHGRSPYLFDDVLLRLIACWLHLANQRICTMALCLKTPVTLRWTRELRAGYTLIERVHHLLAKVAETQEAQAHGGHTDDIFYTLLPVFRLL